MNTAVVNIKVEPQVKKEAKKLAARLGLPLSALIKAYLKQIIRAQEVILTVSEEPTEYLLKSLDEASVDIKAGRVSPTFSKSADALKWLKNSGKSHVHPLHRQVS